eukprot:SAG11_NODE_1541_length_4721_cov_6.831458_3_plen_58_part_00
MSQKLCRAPIRALLDEITARDAVTGELQQPDARFAHRQKSYVSPLRDDSQVRIGSGG